MTDEKNTADLFADDEPSEANTAPKPKADAKKTTEAKPKRGPRPVPVEMDNAVDVTPIHWECECGNTNTHDLKNCGKCNSPRYTTD